MGSAACYHLAGRGASVLVVAGSLQIHGVSTREVILQNLWIEPAKRFEDIHLDMAIFRGSGGLRTPKGQPASGGRVFVENVMFDQGGVVNLELVAGRVDFSATSVYEPAIVRGIPRDGKPFSPLVVNIRGCTSKEVPGGFMGGLTVSGARDVTVRSSRLAGAKTTFLDNRAITFDANKVNSGVLEFKQSAPGRMSKTKLQKCDIYSTQVVLYAPASKGKKERVTIDKCWFKGLLKKQEILAKVIKDADDGEGGAYAKFQKINKRPLELAGPLDR